mmetsp:Transcript_16628/g.37339  ORF Transcript_16628/g.37339 Transcript_16628/m.37339 type:complete len:158 (+) Transcript_16628:121-594(+)
MVRAKLQSIGEGEAALEAHTARSGRIPCVRNTPAFEQPCSCEYSDRALARALPRELFVAYRTLRDETIERRTWLCTNERRQEQQAAVEFMRRRYPNARMCPRCQCGPVINENCPDLQTHQGERSATGHGTISNACRQCGFFSRDWNAWLPWDGQLRD